jgi:hypothetical protein
MRYRVCPSADRTCNFGAASSAGARSGIDKATPTAKDTNVYSHVIIQIDTNSLIYGSAFLAENAYISEEKPSGYIPVGFLRAATSISEHDS